MSENICCVCNEHKKFLGRINAGKKYYCMQCLEKIKQSGMDYWKPCSMDEFFGAILSDKNRDGRKSNMFRNIRETLRQIDEDTKNVCSQE